MKADELRNLIAGGESDRVEFKKSIANPDRIRQTVCALANDLPRNEKTGVVFVGLTDQGTPSGLTIDDKLLKILADIRQEILPFPVIAIERLSLPNGECAYLAVEPAIDPPVRYKNTVFVRVGPTTRQANSAEELRLIDKRRAHELPWDIREAPSLTLDDLNIDFFQREYLPIAVAPEVLAENQRTIDQQLQSLHLANPGNPPKPTHLGILTVGKDPRQHIPGAYIQFIRIDGDNMGDAIIDQKEIDGPLSELLRRLDDLLEINIRNALQIAGGPTDTPRPDYPLLALQQLARNAVMHRRYEGTHAPVRIYWFRNRVEITNPGGPFGMVTRENFGSPGLTDYRNPHLTEAMKNLGFVQKFGVGIPIAQQQLERNGNPPLEFQIEDNFLSVILRSR
ncbi:MAG: transcriptional regulator [Myxococcales bacterium]|nr:transcriptional regulator [Myxococcales bacterium]